MDRAASRPLAVHIDLSGGARGRRHRGRTVGRAVDPQPMHYEASLRASATFAFFIPCRAATRSAHALSAEKRTVRLSITLAASNRAVRAMVSPTLMTHPVRSISPD